MILFHFDVLALPADTLATRQPSPEGRRLWNTFWDRYQGRVVLVVEDGTDTGVLADWLKKEGFKPSIIHLSKPVWPLDSTARAEAVWDIQTSMGKVDWYIDSDADTVARTLHKGIPSLLVAVPHFARPEWHENETLRSWDVVVSELDQQALKKSERSWRDL